MKNKLLKEIQSYKELPEPYLSIAKHIGVENTLILASKFGGSMLYLPGLTSINRQIRNRRIQEEFTGYNLRSLARKHRISIRRAQQIVKGIRLKTENPNNSKHVQLSLFDFDAK
ncbi:Mor transcription activator domain protein [Desulfofarcimen acetoxidans DSM 771]|uniref:Mor transcription activator domain protein n=1 Tax=Desulfofarcimen acetoxidans (strain ATCC 49208 / DSM 771 / KCTC 5769 / VKM B-1644 / 5575) TaxID=485916 RepID=C8VZE3_DESAS|nr:Mor transcription activator family protein [Desulfofarcimen acetoxidans]ACV64888.1 Mor transcription activator domain protein [Desulfofarcimen acetoxidans DSM 771]